jgi:hypothetical protein
MNSAGSDYGLIGETATQEWSLGHKNDYNVLQTPVLTWTAANDVIFPVAGITIDGAGYIEMSEISAPAAPAADKGRLFLQVSGVKTQLCVRFQSGAVQVIATEP